MARMARIKMDGEAAAYHLYGRMAGVKGEYPLTKPLCRKTLIDLIKHYSRGYCCEVAVLHHLLAKLHYLLPEMPVFRQVQRV